MADLEHRLSVGTTEKLQAWSCWFWRALAEADDRKGWQAHSQGTKLTAYHVPQVGGMVGLFQSLRTSFVA